jgi:hypothetical protein
MACAPAFFVAMASAGLMSCVGPSLKVRLSTDPVKVKGT